jgi:hypothetical protein
MTAFRSFFASRPWIFVLLGIAFFTTLTLTFVTIAVMNPPQHV